MDPVNFQDFPVGGTLSFSKQLISKFIDKVALVGLITEETDPVGSWFLKEFNGVFYNYFGIGRYQKSDKKPIIPIRIRTFILLLYYLPKIRKIDNRNVFTQSPQFLYALNFFRWDSLCFCFAGIANSVAISRYRYLRNLGIIYERILFKILRKKANVILAAADQNSIQDAVKRTGNILKPNDIITFPTRFDPNIFYPVDKNQSRKKLGFTEEDILLVTTGRLCWVKGWQLLIDATLTLYSEDDFKKVKLVFIGEGEDQAHIESYNRLLFNKGIIKLAGKLNQNDLALYLNAADVFVMGSFYEGWPTSLVEAMACGCKIVSTNVSAASEIITEGKNGYIVYDRDPFNFARMVKKALMLKDVINYSINIRDKFSVEFLKKDLEEIWLSKI
jgi:glycosyltransferase involved in cell wall biosynthesis